jgi:hypothetical protein
VNIIRGKRQHPDAARADGVSLSRRKVLGGLAALPVIPVLYRFGSAAPAPASAVTPPGSVLKAIDELVRGVERRYNAPLLTPGTRLLLPADITALPIQDYYRHPQLASAETAWPHMTATDGTTIDASIVPERGAPTRIAMLSGFTEARKLPFLWFYGEFGATNDAPYHNWFYTLALQPFSRNPYSRNTQAD